MQDSDKVECDRGKCNAVLGTVGDCLLCQIEEKLSEEVRMEMGLED